MARISELLIQFCFGDNFRNYSVLRKFSSLLQKIYAIQQQQQLNMSSFVAPKWPYAGPMSTNS